MAYEPKDIAAAKQSSLLLPPATRTVGSGPLRFGTKRAYADIVQQAARPQEPSPSISRSDPALWSRVTPARPTVDSTTEEKQEIQASRDGAQLVDDALAADEKFIDFEQLQTWLTALNDGSAPYSYGGQTGSIPMRKVAESPIPGIVMSHYANSREEFRTSFSGLWPEIGRAYVCIDSRIYLWSLYNPADLVSFDPVTAPIEAVALTPLIMGLESFFAPSELALWVATGASISLFRLCTDPSMQLVPTGFVASTEGVSVNRIVYSKCGRRLFYGGSDGHVCELRYRHTSGCLRHEEKLERTDHSGGWLASLAPSLLDPHAGFFVQDICIDETRNVAYTLLHSLPRAPASSKIVVYDLGAYADSMRKICAVEQQELLRKLRESDEGTPYLADDVDIAGIVPLEKTCSNTCQLQVVCRSGLRVFVAFEARNRDLALEPLREDLVFCDAQFTGVFQVLRAIPPPQFSPAGKSESEEIAHVFRSTGGRFMIMARMGLESGKSSLADIAVGEGRLARTKHEGETMSALVRANCVERDRDGLVVDIKEEPVERRLAPEVVDMLGLNSTAINPNLLYQGSQSGTCSFACMPPLSRYPYQSFTEYYVMSSKSVSTFVAPRAVDELHRIISTIPLNRTTFAAFAKSYGNVETCAMLLHIAINPSAEYFDFSSEILAAPAPAREKRTERTHSATLSVLAPHATPSNREPQPSSSLSSTPKPPRRPVPASTSSSPTLRSFVPVFLLSP